MNHYETAVITVAVIRDAILKIASEKPEWFYTEGWLKEILFRTPSNLKPKENFSSDLEHFKKLYEDNPCWDISRD